MNVAMTSSASNERLTADEAALALAGLPCGPSAISTEPRRPVVTAAPVLVNPTPVAASSLGLKRPYSDAMGSAPANAAA